MDQPREYVPRNIQRARQLVEQQEIEARRNEAFGKSLDRIGGQISAAVSSAGKAVAPGYTPSFTPTKPAAISPVTRETPKPVGDPGAVPNLGAASPAVSAPRPTLVRPSPRPGDPNTFTGANGVVRVVKPDGSITGRGSQNGSFNVVPSTAFTKPGLGVMGIAGGDRPGASTQVARYQQEVANAQARNAATANRPSTTTPPGFTAAQWQAELMRRMEQSMGGKQTKTEREAKAAAYGGAMAAGLGEVANEQLSAAQLANTGATNQGALDRTVADNAAALQIGRERNAAEIEQTTIGADAQRDITINRPEYQLGADGTLASITNGRAAPVTGADGTPFRPQITRPQDNGPLLSAYARERAAASQILDPAERAAALEAVDQNPIYAPLRGGGVPQTPAGGATPPAEAIAQLRANPAAAAQFDEVFGQGAAARYLAN